MTILALLVSLMSSFFGLGAGGANSELPRVIDTGALDPCYRGCDF